MVLHKMDDKEYQQAEMQETHNYYGDNQAAEHREDFSRTGVHSGVFQFYKIRNQSGEDVDQQPYDAYYRNDRKYPKDSSCRIGHALLYNFHTLKIQSITVSGNHI